MRHIDLIVIHCSATREDRTYSEHDLATDHRRRGFKGAGYHFYVRKDGKIVTTRPLEQVGAHARGYNANSIGICYEGGLDKNGKAKDTRTDAQKESLISLIKQLKGKYKIDKVMGHRDTSPDKDGDGIVEPHEWIKQCPCFNAIDEYKII
jgi:N-acetylmuramoyl-L-alanine amidase